MCGRVTTVTWNELLAVAEKVTQNFVPNYLPDWPARYARPTEAFPQSQVPLLLSRKNAAPAVEAAPLTWGYLMKGKSGTVFNTRVETAATSWLWRDSFQKRHCVVPVQAFYEPHKTERAKSPQSGRQVKQVYRFQPADQEFLLLAGIWQDDRFSLLTTEPNQYVAPVHPRMPIMLDAAHAAAWLAFQGAPSPDQEPLHAEPLYPSAPVQESLF